MGLIGHHLMFGAEVFCSISIVIMNLILPKNMMFTVVLFWEMYLQYTEMAPQVLSHQGVSSLCTLT